MRSLLPMFDDFFMDDGWDSFFDNTPAMRNRISVPRVDIEDKKDHYEVVAISRLYQGSDSCVV